MTLSAECGFRSHSAIGSRTKRDTRGNSVDQTETIGHDNPEQQAYQRLCDVLEYLRSVKPNDKSEKDRRYAVSITELEKAIGYFYTWVFCGE